MKIRIGNSLAYTNISSEHPYYIGKDKQTHKEFKQVITDRDICCDGCGKPLKNRSFIPTIHRPKSSFNKNTMKLKEEWAVFFFCYNTSKECLKLWMNKRPR